MKLDGKITMELANIESRNRKRKTQMCFCLVLVSKERLIRNVELCFVTKEGKQI